MYDLWLDIEPTSDHSVDGSSDKGIKDQDNLDDNEQKVVLAPCNNPRRIIRGDQRALRHIKSKIKSSNYKLFFINNR